MDIKLPHSLLTQFLKTKASPEKIAQCLSLCGPTIDRLEKIAGDFVYDIEIITNRVDTASAFGIAREAAAILPQFKIQAKLHQNPYHLKLQNLGTRPTNPPVKVQILDGSLVPRFTCIALSDIKVKPSPNKIQKQLLLSGQRPLNNVIDLSNELTLKYGQPVHIFDLNKIKQRTMIVRVSKKNEKIETLDGQLHTLQGNDIVIADGAGQLIDLCGIMGGALSAVDENTTDVLLFVQTYDPRRIRRTSLNTQQRTLAAQIFEKNPDPELVLPVLIEGVRLLKDRAGGHITSNLIDIYPNPPPVTKVKLDLDWLVRFVGIKIPTPQIKSILSALGFKFKTKAKNQLLVSVPSWRQQDINLPQDLAEEITRIHGYFRLPSQLPTTTLAKIETDSLLHWEYQARNYLSDLGFTEIYNSSLVSADLFTQAGLDLTNALKLQNPLSAEYEFLRTSLLPSLLLDLQSNRGKAALPLRLFELANVYLPAGRGLPHEIPHLDLATQGLDFFITKGYLEALAQRLHVELEFLPLSQQSASILVAGHVIGTLASVSPQILHRFQLSGQVIIADLNFQKLAKLATNIHHFTPISPYPPIFEELTVASNQPIANIIQKIQKSHQLINKVEYLTSHQNKHSFKIEFNNPNGLLTQKALDLWRRSWGR